MKVVLDTNVFVSGVFFSGPPKTLFPQIFKSLPASYDGGRVDMMRAEIRSRFFHSDSCRSRHTIESDRGNMLMLVKNFKPDLPAEYVICGNYIDSSMGMFFA